MNDVLWSWIRKGGLSAAVVLLFAVLMGWVPSPFTQAAAKLDAHVRSDTQRDFWLFQICLNTAKNPTACILPENLQGAHQ